MKNAPLHQQQTKIHYTRKSFNNASLARLLGKGTDSTVATICSIDSLYSFTKRLTDAFCCGKPESNKTKQNWSRLRNGKEKFPLLAHIKIFAVGFFSSVVAALFVKRNLSYFFRLCKYGVYCSNAQLFLCWCREALGFLVATPFGVIIELIGLLQQNILFQSTLWV